MAVKFFLTIFSLLLAGHYVQSANKIGKPEIGKQIVGGYAVDISKYSYQAAILVLSGGVYKMWCGASVLSRYYVLTAAHCTVGIDVSKLRLSVGSSYWKNGTQHAIARKVEHPNYKNADDLYTDYDAAILVLASQLVYTTRTRPIPLATALPTAGTNVVVTGWGSTYSGSPSSDVLRGVTVRVIAQANCSSFYPDIITDRMFCAGYASGRYDACQGDSGGPLVTTDRTLVGIVSWGWGCADPNQPGVYASVPKLRSWINSNVFYDYY